MKPIAASRRVLVYRLGSLGDTVVALPCFHRIRQSFPEAELRVLTNIPISRKAAPLEAILKDGGLIDGTIEYPINVRSVGALLALRRAIRAYRPDLLIYLAASRGPSAAPVWRDVLFFWLCGARRMIGAPLARDVRIPRRDPETGDLEPEGQRLARTLAVLGPIDVAAPQAMDLRLTAAEQAQADAALRPLRAAPFVAVNAGGKDPAKDWGEDRWSQFLDRLRRRCSGHALVVVGAPDDGDRADRMVRTWMSEGGSGARGLNLCGRLSPRESAAVLARAALFVGHDSGPLHLAAAGGAPSLGLFGAPNLPKSWHPAGSRIAVIHDIKGIGEITVDQALEKALQLTTP